MSVFQQFFYYFQENSSYIFAQFVRCFLISVYGVLFAAVVRIPVGTMISKRRRLVDQVIRLVSITQTIPFLAMISILTIGLGLGVSVMTATVFSYSLLPIIRNTYTRMIQVDKSIPDVDKGIRMTARQRLFVMELPLSVSIIMAGIRNALVVAIRITAIGAFAGADGLGDTIIRETNATDSTSIILASALPAALMVIIADWLLDILEKRLGPASKKSQIEWIKTKKGRNA